MLLLLLVIILMRLSLSLPYQRFHYLRQQIRRPKSQALQPGAATPPTPKASGLTILPSRFFKKVFVYIQQLIVKALRNFARPQVQRY